MDAHEPRRVKARSHKVATTSRTLGTGRVSTGMPPAVGAPVRRSDLPRAAPFLHRDGCGHAEHDHQLAHREGSYAKAPKKPAGRSPRASEETPDPGVIGHGVAPFDLGGACPDRRRDDHKRDAQAVGTIVSDLSAIQCQGWSARWAYSMKPHEDGRSALSLCPQSREQLGPSPRDPLEPIHGGPIEMPPRCPESKSAP
jgi:hypothetical protein